MKVMIELNPETKPTEKCISEKQKVNLGTEKRKSGFKNIESNSSLVLHQILAEVAVLLFRQVLENMLPYSTIEDAATSLGRNLTMAETLWFNYSANQSDFLLYCHSILFMLLTYTVVPLPSILAELVKSTSLDKYKIQPKVKHPLSDIIRCYKDVMFMYLFVITPFQIVSYPSVKMIEIRTGLALPSGWEILSQLVVYFLIEDYTAYWIHRWLHSNWAYEKIHHIHHEYTSPTGFAAAHGHWFDMVVLGIPTFLGPSIVPGHMVTFWLWIIVRNVETLEIHSGYDFPWNPTKYIPFYCGAHHHDYHHFVGQHTRSNFASVFTYCDYIYGTDKGYRYQKNFLNKLKRDMKSEGDPVGDTNGAVKHE